jgi:Xaa-Pro aminopeptidase
MVVTVEPGIYRPGWGGIRIEDVVLVHDDRCEILSRAKKSAVVGPAVR